MGLDEVDFRILVSINEELIKIRKLLEKKKKSRLNNRDKKQK